jgi:SAM-dependent methyltransferase
MALQNYIISFGYKLLRQALKYKYLNQKPMTFNERAMEYQFVFRQLTKYCPQHVLDVGTGKTALPALINNCGLMVTAIDNIKDFWPKGMINHHYYIIDDNILSTKLLNRFDMITCISVLEHIEDHKKAIQSMFQLLDSGGHLILTFPYNEIRYHRNVYDHIGSNAPKDLPFSTQAFSRKELNSWIIDNNAVIVEQEYWKYFSGDYWSVGDRLSCPVEVKVDEPHQISTVLLKKNNG